MDDFYSYIFHCYVYIWCYQLYMAYKMLLDYYIGVLAILTTALIGFQVYQVLDSREILRKMKKDRKTYKEEMAKSMVVIYRELAEMHLLNQPNFYMYYYIVNMLKAIKNAEDIADIDFLEDLDKDVSTDRTALMGLRAEQEKVINQLRYDIRTRKFKNYPNLTKLISP